MPQSRWFAFELPSIPIPIRWMAAPHAAIRDASDLVVTRGALVRFRRRFLRRFRAGAGLAEHVDVDEIADHRGRRVAKASSVAVVAHLLGGIAKRRVFWVCRPDRVFLIGDKRLRDVAVRRLLPWHVLLALP